MEKIHQSTVYTLILNFPNYIYQRWDSNWSLQSVLWKWSECLNIHWIFTGVRKENRQQSIWVVKFLQSCPRLGWIPGPGSAKCRNLGCLRGRIEHCRTVPPECTVAQTELEYEASARKARPGLSKSTQYLSRSHLPAGLFHHPAFSCLSLPYPTRPHFFLVLVRLPHVTLACTASTGSLPHTSDIIRRIPYADYAIHTSPSTT